MSFCWSWKLIALTLLTGDLEAAAAMVAAASRRASPTVLLRYAAEGYVFVGFAQTQELPSLQQATAAADGAPSTQRTFSVNIMQQLVKPHSVLRYDVGTGAVYNVEATGLQIDLSSLQVAPLHQRRTAVADAARPAPGCGSYIADWIKAAWSKADTAKLAAIIAKGGERLSSEEVEAAYNSPDMDLARGLEFSAVSRAGKMEVACSFRHAEIVAHLKEIAALELMHPDNGVLRLVYPKTELKRNLIKLGLNCSVEALLKPAVADALIADLTSNGKSWHDARILGAHLLRRANPVYTHSAGQDSKATVQQRYLT
ncbi:hypothetical protein COO60DRAFT_1458371 [Scenedesmus sp. NREL 46B-D3]|nr:hypothetical protein COO60DRAFT_1458371 [Scenedesmus sp. NREL 46B-D3]